MFAWEYARTQTLSIILKMSYRCQGWIWVLNHQYFFQYYLGLCIETEMIAGMGILDSH